MVLCPLSLQPNYPLCSFSPARKAGFITIPMAGLKGPLMDIAMRLEDERLYTRKELGKYGLQYSPTQFQRWEGRGLLTPVKPGGTRSSRVHYWGKDVKGLLLTRSK